MNRWRSATWHGLRLAAWISALVVAAACQDKEKEYIEGLNKACSAGDLDRCADLGDSYLRGMSVEKDANKGVEVLRKACDLDGAKACAILAQAYTLASGVPRDINRANQLQGKACEDGDEESCVQACDKLREAVRCLRVGVLSAKGATTTSGEAVTM